MVTKAYLDKLTYNIIGAAIEVHKIMGRGLLESVYHQCMKEEFLLRKINFLTEMQIPIIYKGALLDMNFRCDFFVEQCIVVEIKAVQDVTPVFEVQLLNYMNLLQCPKGILVNFNCSNIFKEGQRTFVNEYFSRLSNE